VSATKARVLEALGKLQRKPVDVPILGGQVWVRPLTVAGMGRIHALMATPNDRHKAASVALAKDPTNPELLKAEADALAAVENAKQRTSTVMLMDCVVDETGERIFSDADEAAASSMPFGVAEQLLTAIESKGDLSDDAPGELAGN
jgi:hypothetical protein